MSLPAGTPLGPYEIVAPLGAGGMGEVYRARDARLDRTVAIKILPDAFANDPERLARFERDDLPRLVLNATTLNTGHAWRFATEQAELHPHRALLAIPVPEQLHA